VDATRLIRMFRAAAGQIRANVDALSQYDSVGGDGDHGTTMVRAMCLMEKAIEASVAQFGKLRCDAVDLKMLLHNIGWAVMGTDGGATGPLFGSFFSGMAPLAAGKKALDAKEFAAALEGGLANIQKYSQAKPGDKTMLDALIPAVQSVRASADRGATCQVALRQGTGAAAQGAEATKKMVARVGRAKNIGEKSLGSPDPGAVSVALIFKGFVEGAETNA
jgi:dihydroxyacetone kinase-like protein